MIYDVQQSVELQQKRVEILEDQVKILSKCIEGLSNSTSYTLEQIKSLHEHSLEQKSQSREMIDALHSRVQALKERIALTSIPVDTHHAEDCECGVCLTRYDALSDFNAYEYYDK